MDAQQMYLAEFLCHQRSRELIACAERARKVRAVFANGGPSPVGRLVGWLLRRAGVHRPEAGPRTLHPLAPAPEVVASYRIPRSDSSEGDRGALDMVSNDQRHSATVPPLIPTAVHAGPRPPREMHVPDRGRGRLGSDRGTRWPEATTDDENLDLGPRRLGTGAHWWVGGYPRREPTFPATEQRAGLLSATGRRQVFSKQSEALGQSESVADRVSTLPPPPSRALLDSFAEERRRALAKGMDASATSALASDLHDEETAISTQPVAAGARRN